MPAQDLGTYYPLTADSDKAAYTGTAGTVSTAIPEGIHAALITVTSDAYVNLTGTATANDMLLVAGSYVFAVKKGQTPSAIQFSAGGTLSVTPLTK